MSVLIEHQPEAAEEQVIEELRREGFEAAAKEYEAGKTEPHRHDYDVALYILEGEMKLAEGDAGAVHELRPGDRVFVPRGTAHHEEHGPLRMVVGRRHGGGERA